MITICVDASRASRAASQGEGVHLCKYHCHSEWQFQAQTHFLKELENEWTLPSFVSEPQHLKRKLAHLQLLLTKESRDARTCVCVCACVCVCVCIKASVAFVCSFLLASNDVLNILSEAWGLPTALAVVLSQL